MLGLFLETARDFSAMYFVRQFLAVIIISICGFFVYLYSEKSADSKKSAASGIIMAFPLGLSVFIIEAYILLSVGIPYNAFSVSVIFLAISALLAVSTIKAGVFKQVFEENRKVLIVGTLILLVLVVFSCSGIAPISISNDSMYYFHEYPRDIVYFSGLRDQFDSFLTDTGLGSVVIETIPFLYGFNESFGIRESMHICFLVFLTYRVYSRCGSKCAAVIAGLLTTVSSPVFILGHWAMANMYFMDFFFMAAVLIGEASSERSEMKFSEILPGALLSVACALLRMEGGIFILFLVGCYTLLNVNGRKLIFGIALPILVLLGIYEIRIYALYDIDNPYTFLTPQKALLQAAAFVCVIIYIALIRDRLPEKIRMVMPMLFIAVLIGANGILLVYNKELYIANLRAFYGNFMGQSGWGVMPQLIVAAVIVLLVGRIISPGKIKASSYEIYFATLTIGFVLVTVAVSFMRGDALNIQVGDSGNRVMMQAAPLVIYTLTLYFVRLYEGFREDET